MTAFCARALRVSTASGASAGTARNAADARSMRARARVERVGEVVGEGLRQPFPDVSGDDLAPPIAHVVERSRELRIRDHRTDGAGQEAEPARCELDARGRGDDLLELVGLVDHDDLVLGQERPVHREMHAVEVGVDHDDVGFLTAGAGVLGEDSGAHRAAQRAGALIPADADG